MNVPFGNGVRLGGTVFLVAVRRVKRHGCCLCRRTRVHVAGVRLCRRMAIWSYLC